MLTMTSRTTRRADEKNQFIFVSEHVSVDSMQLFSSAHFLTLRSFISVRDPLVHLRVHLSHMIIFGWVWESGLYFSKILCWQCAHIGFICFIKQRWEIHGRKY